jgi:hypothetical protein
LSTVIQLPERPSLEQLKKRAREVARDEGVKLTEAQLRIARMYGFASWPKLKAHVEMVTALTREPDEARSEDDFLALVCLTYGDDAPAFRSRGLDMLLDNPATATRDIWAAAATASTDAVRGFAANAAEQGGPFAWEPLMYLCYSRVPSSEAGVLDTARVLLDAGADPNVGYLWHGLPTPFTALTGVFGGGEANQPPHEHSPALARLLLERGANANDAQALYNRQFRPGTEHLELLFDYGLGQGDGGPWRARLGAQMESPVEMLQHQLRWAIQHNMLDRVRLFAERGVDLNTRFAQRLWPIADGRTPAEFALLCGHGAIVDELAKYGALAPELDAVDQFVAAVMAGEEPAGDGAAARERRPSLVVQATAAGRYEAVRIAVEHGFDVNALGRADAPVEQPWQTALHTAVERNLADMVRFLLDLGADPSIEDARFHATPKQWAEHFGYTDFDALLP